MASLVTQYTYCWKPICTSGLYQLTLRSNILWKLLTWGSQVAGRGWVWGLLELAQACQAASSATLAMLRAMPSMAGTAHPSKSS